MSDEIRVSESLYMQEGKLRRQAEAEAARLRAERDRYREALREIDEAVAHGSRDVLCLKAVARAALEGSENE